MERDNGQIYGVTERLSASREGRATDGPKDGGGESAAGSPNSESSVPWQNDSL